MRTLRGAGRIAMPLAVGPLSRQPVPSRLAAAACKLGEERACFQRWPHTLPDPELSPTPCAVFTGVFMLTLGQACGGVLLLERINPSFKISPGPLSTIEPSLPAPARMDLLISK